MVVPLELLRPLSRDDQDGELTELLRQNALIPEVLPGLLQTAHQLRAAEQRHERPIHGAARAGSDFIVRLLLCCGHLVARNLRQAIDWRHVFLRCRRWSSSADDRRQANSPCSAWTEAIRGNTLGSIAIFDSSARPARDAARVERLQAAAPGSQCGQDPGDCPFRAVNRRSARNTPCRHATNTLSLKRAAQRPGGALAPL